MTETRGSGTAPVADDPVIDVRDLRMRYGTKDVLDGVTFTARRGEVLALARRESGSAVAARREKAMTARAV